jgi:hypothetical protein
MTWRRASALRFSQPYKGLRHYSHIETALKRCATRDGRYADAPWLSSFAGRFRWNPAAS